MCKDGGLVEHGDTVFWGHVPAALRKKKESRLKNSFNNVIYSLNYKVRFIQKQNNQVRFLDHINSYLNKLLLKVKTH